jgi:DNA-binding MarR family transcriptional regulator
MIETRQRTASQAAYGQALRLFGLIQRAMRPYFQQFGLSQSQWAVLRTLYRAKDEGRTNGSLRMGEIGHRLLVQPPSVTTVVRRLVKAGLVCQSAAPNDRRGFELRLTAEGEDLARRVMAMYPEQIRQVMGGLNDDELPRFCEYAERLNTHLAALAAQTPPVLD